MTKDALIRKVALHMDEITPDNDYEIAVDGSDNNPLYELIGGLVDGAILELYTVAPYWRLPQTAFNFSTEVATAVAFKDTPYERIILRLKVPSSFLRIAEINYSSFDRPITEIFSEQSEDGKRQHNPYLVGKDSKPVAVMSHGTWGTSNPEQCREIDCYSLPKGTNPSETDLEASYIAIPATAPKTGEISAIPPALESALAWLIASRTFAARGDANRSAICQQYAQNLLV